MLSERVGSAAHVAGTNAKAGLMVFLFFVVLGGLAACGGGDKLTGPRLPNNPPPVSQNHLYKVADTLAGVHPTAGTFEYIGANGHGVECFVDQYAVQVYSGTSMVGKMQRNEVDPQGYNRCDISPDGKALAFQDKQDRVKIVNIENMAALPPIHVSDASTRVLEIKWLSDSTLFVSDGEDINQIFQVRGNGNFLSQAVGLVRWNSSGDGSTGGNNYGLAKSVAVINNGANIVIAYQDGALETRGNEGTRTGYLPVGPIALGQSTVKTTMPITMAWDSTRKRLYMTADSTLLVFAFDKGLNQVASLQLGHRAYAPMVNGDGVFVNTGPGVVTMYPTDFVSNTNPEDTFTFPNPQYYDLGSFACGQGMKDVCLMTSNGGYRLQHT